MTFSIVVPVGAWSPFLPAALRSLTLQGVALEVALCDASGDARVAEAADASGLAFAYRRHGPDKGQADAIAEGWAATRGEFLGWLNADDVLLPKALDAAAAAFEKEPALDLWFGRSTYFDESGATFGEHEAVAPASPLLLRSCTISQPSCFARRSAVDAVGGVDRDRHYTMDWDLWSRLYRNGACFGCGKDFYSAVLINRGSKTSSLSATRLREIHSVVRAGAGDWAALKSVIGVTLHHFSAYSALGSALRNADTRGPNDRLALPVINLGPRDRRRLAVRLSGPGAAAATVRLGAERAQGPKTELTASAAAAPGATGLLEIDPAASPVRLESARWIDD